jgi:hypothetical protein
MRLKPWLRGLMASTLSLGQLWFAGEQASAQDAFYQATASDIAGPVGTLIRSEPRVGGRTAPLPSRFSIDLRSPTDRPLPCLAS